MFSVFFFFLRDFVERLRLSMYMSPLVMLSCCLHVFRALGSVFMFVFVFRLHNKVEYPFT